ETALLTHKVLETGARRLDPVASRPGTALCRRIGAYRRRSGWHREHRLGPAIGLAQHRLRITLGPARDAGTGTGTGTGTGLYYPLDGERQPGIREPGRHPPR